MHHPTELRSIGEENEEIGSPLDIGKHKPVDEDNVAVAAGRYELVKNSAGDIGEYLNDQSGALSIGSFEIDEEKKQTKCPTHRYLERSCVSLIEKRSSMKIYQKTRENSRETEER